MRYILSDTIYYKYNGRDISQSIDNYINKEQLVILENIQKLRFGLKFLEKGNIFAFFLPFSGIAPTKMSKKLRIYIY